MNDARLTASIPAEEIRKKFEVVNEGFGKRAAPWCIWLVSLPMLVGLIQLAVIWRWILLVFYYKISYQFPPPPEEDDDHFFFLFFLLLLFILLYNFFYYKKYIYIIIIDYDIDRR